MPYFKNDLINILFIHIPKTGGSSLEDYFCKKYNIHANNNSLFMELPFFIKRYNNIDINCSLQHLTYKEIIKYKYFFKINEDNLKIISIVRNPYNRIISDLFYLKKININSSKEEVYMTITKYISEKNDNHKTPQYLFVTNDNGELIDNITILRTESLTSDMINLGFTDFDLKSNCNSNQVNYDDYLNEHSIHFINFIYKKDFELFNYKMK
jgi:hypothetical protein